MKNIAIFVSGSGTNFQNIAEYFKGSPDVNVALMLTDNPEAYALERARELGVRSEVVPRADFRNGDMVTELLAINDIDFIVLAGFLSLVPAPVVRAYKGRIVNIHPALLPAYGGKGMYGDRVHRAVVEAGEKESGITIHYVNERYDEGAVIAQYRVALEPGETPESLAVKIHRLEYEHYPEVIRCELIK